MSEEEQKQEQEEQIYTVDDIARILRIDEQTVRKLIKQGSLKAKRVGRQFRITEKMLQDYLDSPEII